MALACLLAVLLSQPLPNPGGCFDAVASYLVLNDVSDYRGFAATLAALLTPGGKLALAFNNPYGAVIHNHVTDYFDSAAVSPYRGLWAAGIKTYLHHRTLENYLDAFLAAGLHLTKLADIPALASTRGPDTKLPDGARFPRFMLLAFTKPRPCVGCPDSAWLTTSQASHIPHDGQ